MMGVCRLIREKYQSLKQVLNTNHDRTIKAGRFYTLIFISRGSCYIEVNGQSVFCGTEDMILMKPNATTILHNRSGKISLEYFLVNVTPEYLAELSDLDINFKEDLGFTPNDISISHLRSESAMLIKNLIIQIISLTDSAPEYGDELFIKNMYSMLVLLTIRSCIEVDAVIKHHRSKKLILDDVFGYISNHLSEEITLETLEREFFVSKYYICREFKQITGLTPHAYIVKSRLNLCCRYIEQGLPITDVYHLGGFLNYNHFFRAFKKEYRMTPKEYYKNIRNDTKYPNTKRRDL